MSITPTFSTKKSPGWYQSEEDETQLHIAVRVDKPAIFERGLQKKPNLLDENKHSQTVCELALEVDQLDYVKALFSEVTKLSELVPQSRQHTFLTSLWQNSSVKLISHAALRYLPKIDKRPYICDFNEKTIESLTFWLNVPDAKAHDLQFLLSKEDWDLLLFHFIGKKTFLFTEDSKHIRQGSYNHQMVVPLLWTWRTFWQNQPHKSPLWLEIDNAIARVIRKPNLEILVQLIKEGKKPVILSSGWYGHSLTVVFFKNLLFLCNRGEYCSPQELDLTAYRIKKAMIRPNLVVEILKTEGEIKPSTLFFFRTLPQALQAKKDLFCKSLEENCQPAELDNEICLAANLRLAIRAILVSRAKKHLTSWKFDTQIQAYKEYRVSARYSILQQYLRNKKTTNSLEGTYNESSC